MRLLTDKRYHRIIQNNSLKTNDRNVAVNLYLFVKCFYWKCLFELVHSEVGLVFCPIYCPTIFNT